jgi:hypothetical protein
MKLVITPEAAAQILVRKQWWRANRSISERPVSFPVSSSTALARSRSQARTAFAASAARPTLQFRSACQFDDEPT